MFGAPQKPRLGSSEYIIQRRILKDEAFERAVDYDRDLKRTGNATTWHTKVSGPNFGTAMQREAQAVKEELALANKEMKLRREHRLRQLFEHEARRYEAELAERGLAIMRDRN